MKTHWIVTSRDELWLACQRSIYCRIVRRAAAHTPCFRDETWLHDALSVLELSHRDYQHDVASLSRGDTPPRLRGEWTYLTPVKTEEIQIEDDAEIVA